MDTKNKNNFKVGDIVKFIGNGRNTKYYRIVKIFGVQCGLEFYHGGKPEFQRNTNRVHYDNIMLATPIEIAKLRMKNEKG